MKKNQAFTLLEIMIVIALIGFMSIFLSKFNFNLISDKQRIEGFVTKVVSSIETIQNNALIGKSIDGEYVPKKWKIDFSNNGDGQIISYYLSGTYLEYSKIIPQKFFIIEVFNDGSKITDTGSIIFEGENMTLSGITTTDKVFKLNLKYKGVAKEVYINTISGVIEEK